MDLGEFESVHFWPSYRGLLRTQFLQLIILHAMTYCSRSCERLTMFSIDAPPSFAVYNHITRDHNRVRYVLSDKSLYRNGAV